MLMSFSATRRRVCRRRGQRQEQRSSSSSSSAAAAAAARAILVSAVIAAAAVVTSTTFTSSIGATALSVVISRPGGSGTLRHGTLNHNRCRHSPEYHYVTTPTIPSSSTSTTTSSLRLTPLDNNSDDNLSDYSKQKQKSELDSLITKRQQIRQSKLANIKPNDDNPKIEEMSDEEIKEMLKMKDNTVSAATKMGMDKDNEEDDGGSVGSGGTGGSSDGIMSSSSSTSLDIDALFSRDYVPDFKTKRSSSFGSRAGDATTPPPFFGNDDSDDDSDKKDEDTTPLFVDWTADYDDENEFHIPNRIGFTTIDWANAKKGFVNGKLKKKDRKLGKYNQSDLKVRDEERVVRV